MNTNGRADDCVARVLDIAGARPLALDAFLRVSAVEWSDEIASACIECADRPRLLLNPQFVSQYCHTPERLAALLLHELAHVSMGHTRMFPRPTPAHNVACDAIINREIAALAMDHQADVPSLTSLFVEYYSPSTSPWFLLRPPPGWPHAPDWSASRGAPAPLRTIHQRLYRTDQLSRRHTVQYGEIVEALQCAHDAAAGHGDLDLSRLLGAHGQSAVEQAALTGGRDATAADVLGSALRPLGGRLPGAGAAETTIEVERVMRRVELERAIRILLRRCFTPDMPHARVTWVEHPSRSALPLHDRRGPARVAIARAYGAPRPLLFSDVVMRPRVEPTRATIYLDTSGSMRDMLPALHAALVSLRKELRPRILLFSTTVVEAERAAFDAGSLRTTGGTSISPVLQHAIDQLPLGTRRVGGAAARALVLTDGWFDQPSRALSSALIERGIALHLGISGPGPLHNDKPWVASATRLPLCA